MSSRKDHDEDDFLATLLFWMNLILIVLLALGIAAFIVSTWLTRLPGSGRSSMVYSSQSQRPTLRDRPVRRTAWEAGSPSGPRPIWANSAEPISPTFLTSSLSSVK